MKREYADWIEMYLDRYDGRPVGLCGSATAEMVLKFPELRRVAGFVYTNRGECEHFWCTTAEGEVVDPTAKQFEWISAYVPWQPGDEVRVGACMNCGEGIYRRVQSLDEPGLNPGVCSEECFDELKKEYG